jgi:hypothetical protein
MVGDPACDWRANRRAPERDAETDPWAAQVKSLSTATVVD